MFEKKGKFEASLHSWKKALKIYSSDSGSDSVDVGEILYRIGLVYDLTGDNPDKAMSCFSEAVKILRSKGEEDNEMIGQALGHIGGHYARKKQYAKAVELSTESLRLQKQFSDAEHIAKSLIQLGEILKSWGKFDQAMQFFQEALRTYEEAFGLDALEVANCRHNIGILHELKGESETALESFGQGKLFIESKGVYDYFVTNIIEM